MKQVCIVGYGAIGPVHASALEGVENARLYAVCDIDPEKRKLCLEKYPVIEYADFVYLKSDNLSEVAQSTQIDKAPSNKLSSVKNLV